MVNAGASIEAVLTLNNTGFINGIEKSVTALSKFQESSKGVRGLNDALARMQSTLQTLDGISKSNLNTFTKLSTAINKMANGLKILQSDSINVEQAVNTMNSIFKAFQGTLNGTEIKVRTLVGDFTQLENVEKREATVTEQVAVATKQYERALELALPPTRNLIIGTNELMLAQNGLQKEELETASATDKATNSMNKQNTASKSLGKAMSSLRMIGTMVASMMVWNFASSLVTATRETVNAKSEMEGYFQMLGFTTSQVDNFNKALDNTVKKFPRLNKYALGETISSIGVEFELSTKEMEKAMPVVSMITSEYLRAGRNVNEASLAVKDILQGEFQRLSRETGVKGDQLKEAGWSGDKNDVMGLLEALDKVGKSRNWDVFVTKANSLNDAVLIMQNRFGEFSADLVNRFQPSILKVFNDLMVIATSLGKALNGVLDWFDGKGIGQSIAKWGGLALVLTTVASGLAVFRTGANLSQIAQMGLLRTTIATTLGLEGEAVAEHGLIGAMLLRNEAIDVQTLKEYGRLNSLTAVITGLKAEEVAEIGKTKALLGAVLGVDMATLSEKGFTVALIESTTSMEIAEIEALSLAEAVGVLSVSFALPLAIIGAFTGALILNAMEISSNTEKYSKFVNMLEKGNDIISEAKDTVDNLTNSSEALDEKLQGLEKGTYEYEVTANKLAQTQDELNTATRNYEDAVNSVAWVKHKQQLYDDEKAKAQLDAQKDINEALLDYGFNVKEARELSNEFWLDATMGWDQHYETLQKVNRQYEKNAISVQSSLKKLNDAKVEPKEVEILIRPKIASGNKIADAKERMGNATGLMEYIDAWLWLQVAEMENAMADWDINMASGGLSEAVDGIATGFVHFLADNLFGQIGRKISDSLGLTGSGEGMIGDLSLSTILIDNFSKVLDDLTGFDTVGKILNAIFPQGGSPSDSSVVDVLTLVQTYIINPIHSAIETGFANNFPTIVAIVDLLDKIFDGDVDGIYEWVNVHIIDPLVDGVKQGIENTPVLGSVAKLILGEDSEGSAESKGQETGSQFSSGVQTGIAPLDDVINKVFSLDDATASFTANSETIKASAGTTATEVSGSFSSMKTNQKTHLDNMVSNNTTAFKDMNTKSTTEMIKMRDSTSQVTQKMSDAWSYMKDSIVKSADKIKTDSKQRFDDLGGTISSFYKKIQNPSLWGAGHPSMSRGVVNPRGGRTLASMTGFAGNRSVGSYTGKSTMSVASLKRQICPNGDCGNLFDGYSNADMIDVQEFLLGVTGEHGFGGWDFAKTHNTYIKNQSDAWDMKSPVINLGGGISTNTPFKVKEFNDGKKPQISFEKFQSIAGSVFSAIPYRFYYDSSWKGSWLGALMSGACNCFDGASALIALARTFGFDGYIAHGDWGGIGHVWAVINGIPMDTTAFQGGYGWTSPKVHGYGSPNIYKGSNEGKTVNVNIDMSNSTIYGVEDLDNRVEEATKRAMREEFNDPYTIAL